MKSMIKPPLVLTIICCIVSGLLVYVYNLTYVDNTGIVTKEMKQACQKIFDADEFYILTKSNESKEKQVLSFGEVKNIIKTDENDDIIIMNVITDGYEHESINALIGLDKNCEVVGVSILSLNETPGLGTKIDDDRFLSKFIGKKDAEGVNAVDGITAATYSSNGLKNAIIEAQTQLTKNKGVIFGE